MSKSTYDAAALDFIDHKFTPNGQKCCHRPKVCCSQESNLIGVRLISSEDNDQFSTENILLFTFMSIMSMFTCSFNQTFNPI